MRKEYRKAVRVLFEEGLRGIAPEFRRARIDSPLLFSGETVFRHVADERRHLYVLLVPSPTGHQAFTLEIGWSMRGRFPEGSMRPTHLLTGTDLDPMALDETIVRLGDVAGRGDAWWQLPDPAVEHPGSIEALVQSTLRIDEAAARADATAPVHRALAELERIGLPLMLRWKRSRGH